MSDLSKRLRAYRSHNDWGDKIHHPITDEAADALDALQAELSEQARIIGASGERDARHLAMIAERDREIARLRRAIGEAEKALENTDLWGHQVLRQVHNALAPFITPTDTPAP
ncbi:hypothetical protein ACFOON_15095 [Novosphingobium piscinae]|uniref:Ead/Ea22-like family protein n=1 Tax=Novosphingobium piscinae TaxID=1507448 RepID=A0A7X1KPS6_9SPHN|nr:hypothetical protein [Novosphingobium piscinae]MBC2668773.1 hypothetical protein [Novosphingobium piscinae]